MSAGQTPGVSIVRGLGGTIAAMLVAAAAFFCVSGISRAAAEPAVSVIRRISEPAFVDGRPVESVWRKADVLTGFVEPVSLNRALQETEARLLHDEDNLYIYLKAHESFGGPKVHRSEDAAFRSSYGDIMRSDNFEIFIQPDVDGEVYYQVVVSAGRGLYTARGRSTAWEHGIKVDVSAERTFWNLVLTIPLADIGISAPSAGEERNMRLNISRHDISVPAPEGGFLGWLNYQPSLIALLDSYDYHQPARWAEAVMVHESAVEPRTVINRSPRVNLIRNPRFDITHEGRTVGWRLGRAAREETMLHSDEWVIRAPGSVYHFMRQNVDLVPGETYTFRIRARMFGEGQAFGIMQRVRGADGSIRAGGYIGWETPLTTQFHEYYLTFKADEDLDHFLFYRFPGGDSDMSGVEIEAVHLYEGEISPFEIRKIARVGLKRAVEGTEPPIPPNFHGAKGDNPRVLAVVSQFMSSREIFEIFKGLDVDFDVLMPSSREPSDVYYTDFEPQEITERVENNEYDLYMVGRMAVSGVGEELAGKIASNVEEGAGLLINNPDDTGKFSEFISGYRFPRFREHYLMRGFPSELYPLRVSRDDSGTLHDPAGSIMAAEAGKGRIILADTVPEARLEFRVLLDPEAYGHITFPHRRYSDAWLARMVYYAAGKMPAEIRHISRDGGSVEVEVEGAPGGASVRWRLEDKNGRPVSEERSALSGSRASITLPQMNLAGYHVLAVWAEDAEGYVLDYCAKVLMNEGPAIVSVESAKEYYTGNEYGEFTVRTEGAGRSMKVAWELEDFSGRVLESGGTGAADEVNIRVPLEAVYTNLARLWVYLREGGTDLDAQRFPVYVPDRDRERLWNDFNVNIWPPMGGSHPDAFPIIARQLQKIGVRSTVYPSPGYAGILAEGMGVGGTWRGGGGIFLLAGERRQVRNNIRVPSLGDPDILERVEERATRVAKDERRYGVINTAVCDEPQDAFFRSSVELDAHPENLKEYRRRMKEKYKTIEAFNERCSTDYDSFAELNIVLTEDIRKRENFAEFVEWRNYNVDRWVEAIRIISDVSREIDGAPLSLLNSFGQIALSTTDYWKLLTEAGLDFSHEYADILYGSVSPLRNVVNEFYRSFRPDMRIWGWVGFRWTRDHSKFHPWWAALHRHGGFSWYAALRGGAGGGTWWNILDMPNFGFTEDAKALKENLPELLEGMGKLFLEYEWEKRNIAVLYSQPSLLLAWCRGVETYRHELISGSPYYDYHHSRSRVRHMLEELLYQYDFIAPEQIRDGALDSYRVLVLPHIEALSDEDIRLIKAFMDRGGRVVTDIVPGAYDELGTPRELLPFAGEKEKGAMAVFGDVFDYREDSQRERMLGILRESGAVPIVTSDGVPGLKGREAMHFRDGKMNVYAVTRNFTRSDDSERQKLVFPRGGHLYDLREGKYLGEGGEVEVAIPNAGTVVYGVYPYRVEGIEIEGPSSVSGGEDLEALIRVKTGGESPGKHVFRVEAVSPGGEADWFMCRNVSAPGGEAEIRIRMAENDPEGEWVLRVRDVMTGTEAERSFVLN